MLVFLKKPKKQNLHIKSCKDNIRIGPNFCFFIQLTQICLGVIVLILIVFLTMDFKVKQDSGEYHQAYSRLIIRLYLSSPDASWQDDARTKILFLECLNLFEQCDFVMINFNYLTPNLKLQMQFLPICYLTKRQIEKDFAKRKT